VTKNTTITPDKIGKIENALEERKTKRDRRNKVDPSSPHTAPKADRRTGRDRRDEG
jgi:hypothetical protein